MFFTLFIITTLLEIYVLVSVGEIIGGFFTVLLVVITALIGSFLLKQQGWSTITKAKTAIENGQTPALEMLEGVIILISGVLLLTPGFITDSIGLLGLIPYSRTYFVKKILTQKNIQSFSYKKHTLKSKNINNSTDKNTIEGEFWQD